RLQRGGPDLEGLEVYGRRLAGPQAGRELQGGGQARRRERHLRGCSRDDFLDVLDVRDKVAAVQRGAAQAAPRFAFVRMRSRPPRRDAQRKSARQFPWCWYAPMSMEARGRA